MVEPKITTYPSTGNRDVPSLALEDDLKMEPFRCPKCGRFLFYHAIIIGAARGKCKNCDLWVTLEIIPPDILLEDEGT
ncbi:hypothetical protein LCGC14_1172430 [marine sediment metagenome]|uniref:Uncharacterized protein n=1 Tax=marine sediment metagenome TaxID=412755 RepID=A0A0F9LPI7_9ZZZZ